jgi:hypothetical protein
MYHKTLTAGILLITCICLNTATAQNVASPVEKKIGWNLNPLFPQPMNNTFSIAPFRFGKNVLPSISESFETRTRAVIIFSDFQYEVLNGFAAYKAKNLKALKGTVEPVTYYSLEGNKGHTGYSICPFKEVNGTYYILKSFKYSVKEGAAFSAGMNVPSAKRASSNSVLASGQWFRFSVTQDGIYKIDASMLNAAGINTGSIDPRKIKIYGHQGGMLSEVNADFRYPDLPENAIQVIGESDGKFDNSDYILFYAQSPHKWKFNSGVNRFVHETNIYSDKTCFFLTADGANGIRMGSNPDGSGYTANASYNWFDYFTLHNEDKEYVCNEGRVVVGEKFDQVLVHNFNHNLSNISTDMPLKVHFSAVSIAPASSTIALMINGGFGNDTNFPPYSENHDCYNHSGLVSASASNISNPSVQLSFTYNKPTSSSKAWLDFYELHCSRKLIFSEGFMPFQNIQSAGNSVAEYRLSGLPSSYQIFDVTDPVNVKVQAVFQDNAEYVFKANTNGKVSRYVLNDGNTMAPVFEGAVPNQNLHATPITQFIIISPPEFLDASNKLAEFHRQKDNLVVLVVTPQQVYNEFSSGSQDISAIRDFLGHVYYRNSNPANQLKYAMLMGDASFDFKNKLANNNNYIPTYESEPKMDINYSYFCSDDFYGLLDSLDGNWISNQKLEIPVNRLPVASPSEAMSMVDKIINYKTPSSLGEWRTFVTLCADDADDASWEPMFVNDFEEIYRNIDTTYKNLNVRKVYIDAYKQQNLGGSQRYPEAQEAIKKEFEKGTLIFNYVGHGGEEYLATEKVIDIPLITGLKNIDNLPVFFTATCEFSRYDDARRKSAGEYVITNPVGGAVAMFTTVRVVGAGDNADLTRFFWSDCAFVKIGGKWPTLGDIYKKLKNRNFSSSNDWNFTLFADPALTMNYPEHIIIIDSINQSGIGNQKDTIKALSKVTFSGHIEDISGQKLPGFNGSILPIVYDKPSVFKTLGNDNPTQQLPFGLYSSILYKGENSVKDGLYSFSFVVPKDINYNYGFGKISMYAKNGVTDANGHYTDLVVGGATDKPATDVTGPQLELFIDDYSFISGGLTDNSPLLLARIFDENGINTSGNGIGRDIVATIDKGTPNEKKFILNTYYQAKLNSYTTGDIRYQLEGIAEGVHTYTLKVWDVYNNSSEATIEFVIKRNDELTITNVLNYPNPFSSNTTFHFDHNRSGENLHVVLTVLTISGKVLKTIEQTITSAPGHVSEIQWNGRDDYDDKPSKGVYIYRLTVTTEDGKKAEKVEKLVILN